MAKKSRPPKGTSKASSKRTYLISKFLAQFGRELCEGQTQKIRKNDQKTHTFEAVKGRKGDEWTRLPKSISTTFTKYAYQISTSRYIWNLKENYKKNKVKK